MSALCVSAGGFVRVWDSVPGPSMAGVCVRSRERRQGCTTRVRTVIHACKAPARFFATIESWRQQFGPFLLRRWLRVPTKACATHDFPSQT